VTRRPAWLSVFGWVAVCFALVYAADIGRGFIKDDFSWILHSPLGDAADVRAAFTRTPMGFYRPLVTLSFGLDQRLFGVAPMAYAWTNFAVALMIAALVAATTSSMGLGGVAGAFAAGLWALNFHGINMALQWASGRTSLLASVFAVAAALAFVRRRYVLAGVGMFFALLSKEEPLLLPLVFALWTVIDARGDGQSGAEMLASAARTTWPSFAGLGAYFALRLQTVAFTPGSAPAAYQLTPAAILPNALQYLDRSLTFTAAILVLGTLIFARRLPALESMERRVVAKGAVWLVLGYALTIMIRSRSNLYVVFPSIGSAFLGAAIARAVWRAIPPRRLRAAAWSAALLPLALWPIYHVRNGRMRDEAVLSSEVMARIKDAAAARPGLARVVIHDDPTARPSAADAFGGALGDAVQLTLGRRLDAAIVAGRQPASGAPPLDDGTLNLQVRSGVLVAP
jgi:hypothetical protein